MSGARRTRDGHVPPCGAPTTPHALKRARLYPGGWLCDRHAPWAVAGRPEPIPLRPIRRTATRAI